MPVERPTFSESWYRVANLRPRLRSSLQTSRQHFRGQRWIVVQDPSSNQFFRLNEAAYRFVALLDGERTVAEVWRICNEQLGDSAPTQGEAIQLLGQLYTSNLLHAELPPDAEGLFNRYRKRKRREIQSYLMNLLFIRIPLIDPDRFLNRWVGVVGRLFTKYVLLVWLGLITIGVYFAITNWGELASQTERVFSAQEIRANLPLLYFSLILVKVCHEFGHAFACKRFGQLSGARGEVHVMGVMFLVFMPLPYVDASSMWEFGRNKWHRVIVGGAGMLVELAIASVVIVIWAKTSPGTPLHAICYNIIFIASVSTLLFNGNPLLRFDAYYILSDILEIPNLSNRSKEYVYYLVKKYVWRVRHPRNPAHTTGEKRWFVFYGIASTLYRVFICIRILLFVADKLFFVGAALAITAVVAWVLTPLYKFVRYLATSGELARVRGRAVAITVGTFAVIIGCVSLIPFPDRYRLEGVTEPAQFAAVHADSDGYIREFLPTRTPVTSGDWVVKGENYELECELQKLLADREGLLVRWEAAVDAPTKQGLERQIEALDKSKRVYEERLSGLTVRPEFEGVWISPDIEHMKGVYVRQGEMLGWIASLEGMIIRTVADQEFPRDEAALGDEAEVRARGRPDIEFKARIKDKRPAGEEQLFSQALARQAGGPIAISPEDRQGTKAAERFFEIDLVPERGADGKALPALSWGQRVVVRFSMPKKPLIFQWWQSVRQLVLRRFHK